MGLEATWSLVDIPTDARDAAQAAARREGLSVGEWLTRRILKRFSELNVREQEDAFVVLRNHVNQLAGRIDRFEIDSRAEPMREALKKLHEGLTRLNDELVRTAGHSAIQISQLSSSLEALNGQVDGVRQHDVESRDAFERRMAQLQEFVEGVNLRHSAETRTITSRMDSLGGTLAESRRLIADERSAIERLEESVAKADARYSGAFRTFGEKFDSLSTSVQSVSATASQSTSAIDQRMAALRTEFANAGARYAEDKQLATARLEKLHGKIDDLQADITGMCGALDRRVLLSQQAVQSLDLRHAEMSQALARSVETTAAQMETVRAESARNAANLETRLTDLENAAKNKDVANSATEIRFDALEHGLSDLANSAGNVDNRFAAIEHGLSDLANRAGNVDTRFTAIEHGLSELANRKDNETGSRLAAIEHQLSNLTDRTTAAMSVASALLPKTEALETRLGEFNSRFDTEVEGHQRTIEQLKADLLQQTLSALGQKLEIEGRRQQAAIIDLKNGLLEQLSQAFDERTQAEEHKQQDAMAQLQSSFSGALQNLGERFELQARKQQEAIAELKASLATTSAHPQVQEFETSHGAAVVVDQAPVLVEPLSAYTEAPAQHSEEQSAAPAASQAHEEPMLELSNIADQSVPSIPAHDNHAGTAAELPAIEASPATPPETPSHPGFEPVSLGGVEHLASAAMLARDNSVDPSMQPPSYLLAARQSLQTATIRNDGETAGKELFGLRFLKSLSLAAKQKGQATSYALIAGIALLAILAIIVGAAELMSRSEPATTIRSVAKSAPAQARPAHVANYVAPKSIASPSAVPAISGQDRTASLAKGGNSQAQLLLGLRELAKNDATQAAPWLERSAAQGLPVAQYRLATLYASGRGVSADKAKAFHWYLAAAQAGNRKAMSNLAVAYAQGDGTTKNPQEAGRWFLKAAQLGLADAQFDLAILYERGLGVPQNLTDAYRWYVIAARSGDPESKDRVEALGSQLTGEDRAAAETAAAEFKPQPINARANEPQ